VFSFQIERVKVKRKNKNQFVISKLDNTGLVQLIHKEKEKELDISSFDDSKNKVSLPADSLSKINLPHFWFDYVIDQINLSSLYYKAILSIMIDKVQVVDMKLLREDKYFKNMSLKVNKSFQENYNALAK